MDGAEGRLETWAVDEVSGGFGEFKGHFVAGATVSIQVSLDRLLMLYLGNGVVSALRPH